MPGPNVGLFGGVGRDRLCYACSGGELSHVEATALSSQPKLILCPYCGNTQNAPEDRCAACGGFFDALSLKVTQQHMGPWFIRDRNTPFRPGCSYEVLVKQVEKAKIKATTILKGPTTRQFWSVARNVPGVAHLLGYCHACGAHCQKTDESCNECGEVFFAPKLRDNLGLSPLGSEVSAKTALSETGSFTAAPDTPAVTGSSAPSQPPTPPPTVDQPVGSAILAGLRSDGSQMSSEPMGSVSATPAGGTPDALAWLTSSDQTEPDSLATPASSDNTAPIERTSGPGTWTWVLVGVNALLLAILIGAAVYIIGGGTGNETPPGPSPEDPTTSPEFQGGFSTGTRDPDPEAGGQDDPALDIADPNPVDVTGKPVDKPDESVGPDQTIFEDGPAANSTEKERERYAQRFREARQFSRNGEYQDAMKILNQIKQAPRNVQPDGLDAAIKQVQQKIEDQKFENFF